MATVTPPSTRNLAEDNRRVRGPLDRLRGYIRTYVSLEGLARALFFLAVCFWVGYLIDYGFFWLFRIDLIDYLAVWFRGSVLGVLSLILVAMVVTTVLIRLLKEFSDVALALVLERRFPGLLGDRLITAVELSDPDKAAQYGYSSAMVRETIREASERVQKIPVGQVFDWKRLRRAGLVVLGFTVLGYLLALGVASAVSAGYEGKSVVLGCHRFNDLATIWFERNVLLQHRPWPRNAYLEVIDPTIRPEQELRIGQDVRSGVTLRVRAYRYLLADYTLDENWRPLTWKDLSERHDLLGEEPVQPPADWTPRDARHGLTVDEIALCLKLLDVRKMTEGDDQNKGWNISDGQGGWRPLLWGDLTSERLGKLPVPELELEWDNRGEPIAGVVGQFSAGPLAGLQGSIYLGIVTRGLPVTHIESQLPKLQAQKKEAASDVAAVLARLERIDQLQTMMDRLNQRIEMLSMSRVMRKLRHPGPGDADLQQQDRSGGEQSSESVRWSSAPCSMSMPCSVSPARQPSTWGWRVPS